jgi:hypothetical protein
VLLSSKIGTAFKLVFGLIYPELTAVLVSFLAGLGQEQPRSRRQRRIIRAGFRFGVRGQFRGSGIRRAG